MRKILLLLAMVSFIGLQAFAQTTVTGTVTDPNGDPVPGANVSVKGTDAGTITDLNGSFSINVPAGATTLVFSFVGMKTTEVEIAGQKEINFSFETEDVAVEEVIVLGYSTKAKNSITGSTIQVKGDDLKGIPVVSVDQTLQGKVAGLTISSSSGTPGSIQDIRIRGISSFNASNDPLFVIDGVPVINSDFSGDGGARSTLSSLSALNSADIESITVLKDASATSAYGARGSNGVIVITTKKGKTAKTTFNASVIYGFQNKAINGPEVLTGAQREELYLESIYNSYGTAFGFTEAEAYDFADANGLADEDGLNAWIALGRPETNWGEVVLEKNAPTVNVSFSATGGDETSSFYASLGYNKTNSIIIDNSFRRINGSLNYNRKFGSKAKFSTSNSVSNTLQDGLALEQSAYFANPVALKYFMPPWIPAFDENGNPNITNTGSNYSWLYLKDHDVNFNDMTRGLSNSNLEIEIIKGLKFKTLAAIDFSLTSYKNYANKNYGDAVDYNGYAEASTQKNFNIVTQNSLSYNFSFDDHFFSTMVLMEFQKNNDTYLYGYGEDFVTEGLTNINSSSANWNANSTFNDWMNASYLGMVNYDFKGKYIADITYRREGSSRFDKGKRFGNFYALGAAWNVHSEDFMSNLSFIDNFKIRASYGVSGNSGIATNSYQSLLSYNANYAGTGAIYPSGYGNPTLTWEKNRNYDFGFDFSIFKNLFSGSFSYFNKLTYDLLQQVPLSRTTGFTFYNSNVGEMVNKGIEAIINVNIIKSKDLNVSISLNYATLDNEVTKLAKDAEGNDIVFSTGTRKTEVGHPLNEWYMKTYAGVDPDNGLPQWYLNGVDGEVTNNYYDVNLLPVYQGASAIPTYSGGGSFHIDFKGVYFDANVYFAGGHKVFEDWSFYTNHAGYYPTALYQGVSTLMNRWQEPGDITDVPIQLYSGTANNASRTSSRFLYDGTYMRLKDMVLGYNFPKTIINRIKLQSLSIFLRGTNLFTWVKDDRLKYDPEVRADGFTRLTNPPIKSVSFGLNLNF